MAQENAPETDLTSATRTLRAARMRELQDVAKNIQFRLGFLEIQFRKVAAERERLITQLLEGEREYVQLEQAEKASAEQPSEPTP
jgi:hypothetical protein